MWLSKSPDNVNHLPTTSSLADIPEHFVERKEQPSPSEDYLDQANAAISSYNIWNAS